MSEFNNILTVHFIIVVCQKDKKCVPSKYGGIINDVRRLWKEVFSRTKVQ